MSVQRHVLHPYGLIASALAGRLVEVAPAEPGEPAWTDGATIFVDADDRAPQLWRAVVVQASLLGAGSLEPEISARLARRASLTRRYLAIEGHRALAAHEAVLPGSMRSLIDRSLAARTTSPEDSLRIAASRDAVAEPPPVFGTIRPRRLRPAAERAVHEPVAQHDPRRVRTEAMRDLDDRDESGETVADLVASPVGGTGPLGRLLKKFLGDARTGGTGPPGADSPTRRSRRSTGIAANTALSTVVESVPDGARAIARAGTTYPEWDAARHRYRPHWCTVHEVDESRETRGSWELPDAQMFRRPLARLGLELDRRRRRLQGDDIDLDAVVEMFVDTAAGVPPAEAVYVESLRCRRDLAVLLLLDVSGSASEPGAAGRTVHEHQRATAAALTIALHELGDRVALYGFRSQGRSAVHALPVKRFDDALDAVVFERLGALTPGAYTRLGAAIRHGAAVLEDTGGTARRLLVVLSDGFAYDHGYEGAYGQADARRALAEARRRGTGCLCLSIGAGTDADALRRVFGTAAHASLPRMEELPAVVGPLFRAALRSAELQRRVWQRAERTRERLAIDRRTASR